MQANGDQAVRREVLDPARSFIIEAPAGSGKTTLLTHRILRLLTTVEQPEHIVAVTFTRKAVEEMRARILDALALAASGEPADEFGKATYRLAAAVLQHDRRCEWNLAQHPARLRIMTIDALCVSIVGQSPLASGATSAAALEEDADALYREAARATIGALGDGGGAAPATALMLRHLDNDWARLEVLVAEMLAHRDQWLRVIFRSNLRAVIEASLRAAIDRELAAVDAAIPAHLKTDLAAAARAAADELARDGDASPIVALAGVEGFPRAVAGSIEQWRGLAQMLLTNDGAWRKRFNAALGFKRAAAAHKRRIGEIVEALTPDVAALRAVQRIRVLPHARFAEGDWRLFAALADLLKSATANFKLLSLRGQRTDFTEVALGALSALGTPEAPSDLGLILDYRIQHLLVDEFQDTSVTQFELIERLTAGWGYEDGRTLFLVGDPMQSIYRFRQADVQIFKRVTSDEHIGSVMLSHRQLAANFRAQASLVEWLNRSMPVVLANAQDRANTFVTQHSVRQSTGDPALHLHAWVEYDAAAEATRVVDVITVIRARHPQERVAILVRSRSHLGSITARLIDANVPVAVREIQPLLEFPVIADLMALTQALLHLGDRVAWLSVLRAPWCGLSLDALHVIAAHRRTVLEALGDDDIRNALAAEDRARVERFVEVMQAAVAMVLRGPLARIVDTAWTALGGPACADERRDFPRVRRYLEVLEEVETRYSTPTMTQLYDRINRVFSSTSTATDAAVEVMTIHAAKGLEFDTVIIPGLGRPPRGDQKRLLVWHEDITAAGGTELLMSALPTAGGGNGLYEYLRHREKEEAAAEGIRLLYVAITRARRQVHLLGHAPVNSSGGNKPAPRSFIANLWPVIEQDFTAANVSRSVTGDDPGMGGYVARPLRRLERPAKLAARGAAAAVTVLQPPEFDWAGLNAKHIGTVTHQMLQSLSAHDFADAAGNSAMMRRARGRLRALGIASAEVDAATARVSAAVASTLGSERGQWIFAVRHTDVRAELRLSAVVDDELVRVIIDRTFVDPEGYRWIIDFKTGEHGGGALDAYLDAEVERYKPQLHRYAEVMGMTETRPIMLGLYFPLHDAWRQWRFELDSPTP